MRDYVRKVISFCTFLAIVIPCWLDKAAADDCIDTLVQREKIISKDITHKIIRYNLSKLWTTTRNDCIFGYIGKNYQRLQIKFITAQRDSIDSTVYNIQGKDRVKDNVCSFQGNLTISKAFYTENVEELCQKTGILIGKYTLKEDTARQHSGVFTGRFITYWYIDALREIHYDKLLLGNSDAYCNNQFIGTWKRNSDTSVLECRWGDYRIPGLTETIDNGAAEFHMNDKYQDFGWDTFLKAFLEHDTTGVYQRKEREEWWK